MERHLVDKKPCLAELDELPSKLGEEVIPKYVYDKTSYQVHSWKIVEQDLESLVIADVEGALLYVGRSGYNRTFRFIADSCTDDKPGLLNSVLHEAATQGHEIGVGFVIDEGADANARRDYGTALTAASIFGREKMVQALIDRGADVNAQVGIWGSELQAASYYGHGKIVTMLLDRGADVNTQGGSWGSALQAALNYGGKEVAQMLLDRGAMTDVQEWGLRQCTVDGISQ